MSGTSGRRRRRSGPLKRLLRHLGLVPAQRERPPPLRLEPDLKPERVIEPVLDIPPADAWPGATPRLPAEELTRPHAAPGRRRRHRQSRWSRIKARLTSYRFITIVVWTVALITCVVIVRYLIEIIYDIETPRDVTGPVLDQPYAARPPTPGERVPVRIASLESASWPLP